MDQIEVGRFIRTRREALQPEDVGLRRGSRRRSVGLRREEVADLADMSTDYLSRLERGAGPQPSVQMINALARGLRLAVAERDHLLRLAGHQPSTRPGLSTHVNPGLMRILDRLIDTPAQVMGPLGETLAQNPAAIALLGEETHHTGTLRSATYRWFTDPTSRSLYPQEDHEHHSRVHVSQLRTATARLDPASTTPLIQHLQQHSPEFSRIWETNEVGLRYSEEKRFMHPEVGDLTLFCQVVLDPDEMQTLLVFTATPGTTSAERLRLLTVVGSTALAAR